MTISCGVDGVAGDLSSSRTGTGPGRVTVANALLLALRRRKPLVPGGREIGRVLVTQQICLSQELPHVLVGHVALAAPVDLPREDPLVPFLQARGPHEDHVPRGD